TSTSCFQFGRRGPPHPPRADARVLSLSLSLSPREDAGGEGLQRNAAPVTRYILQRLLLLPLLMLIYSFVIFVIIQAPPGAFLTAYVATLASSGSSISAEQIAALRHQYGLDQPFVVQYFLWVEHLFHGDFGLSLEYQRPNAELIG